MKAELGSLIHIASGIFKHDETRVRQPGEARASGTIAPRAMLNRKKEIKDFLAYMNDERAARQRRGCTPARLRP